MAATTTYKKKVSSSHIPEELAFSILSKLPLKTLKRFTCVRKSWSLIFENSHFMNMFRNHFFTSKPNEEYENTSLLIKMIYENSDSLSKLSTDKFEDRVILDWPPPFKEDHLFMEITGSSSVNGIICLYMNFGNESPIVLWNPATTEFKVLPSSFQPFENIEFNLPPIAFGYDCVRDDYNVLRYVKVKDTYDICTDFHERMWYLLPEKDSPFWELLMDDDDKFWWKVKTVNIYDPFLEIYSLKSNSWRKLIERDVPLFWPCDSQANSNELSHFIEENEMVSFDFTNQKFIVTAFPSDSNVRCKGLSQQLLILNESVAFVFYDDDDDQMDFHIWILGKLGVKKSWTKLLVIQDLTYIGYPVLAWKNNLFFSYFLNHTIARYNLGTQKLEQIKVCLLKIITYKEVVRSIEGMST